MKLIIIAALNRKGVIGRNGKIPWHIPEDMERFKELTTGHTVLMGRKTFESIGKPLPGRRNVVITSRNLPAVEYYHSINEALAALGAEEKVFVIGGGEIYKQTIARADSLLLSVVDDEEDGDTYFPNYQELIGKEFIQTNAERRNGFSFVQYERTKTALR